MKSFFLKIFLSCMLLIMIVSGTLYYLNITVIKEHYVKTLAVELTSLAESIAITLANTHINENKLDAFIKQMGKKLNVRITIINHNGKVLADSEKYPELMENHGTRPEILQAQRTGRPAYNLRFSTTVKEEMLYVALPVFAQIKNSRKLKYFIRTSIFLHQIKHLIKNLRKKIFQITVIMALISLIATYIFFSIQLAGPIRQLSLMTKKVAEGNFEILSMVSLTRKDEIGILTRNFYIMSERLRELFISLKLQKEELIFIIESLKEGLAVIDKNDYIFLTNNSFRKNFQIETEFEEKCYWEIIRNSEIVKIISRSRNEKADISEEHEINGKIFLCSATFMSAKEEIILLLHDITEFKKFEKIKKDFVASVSHELKTPLTAIQGYIETLEEEHLNQDATYYVKIIKRNTERLTAIVRDLLTLSAIEDKSFVLNYQSVDVVRLLNDVCLVFKDKAAKKNINLNLEYDKNLNFIIMADAFRLEQIFVNIIDNAIKYTERGEVKIKVSRTDTEVIISVKDTGIGIPEQYIEKIFERFYVVDKSRSRQRGGTGLGLSIVKHLLALHKGKISVQSKVGSGTTFTLTFFSL